MSNYLINVSLSKNLTFRNSPFTFLISQNAISLKNKFAEKNAYKDNKLCLSVRERLLGNNLGV